MPNSPTMSWRNEGHSRRKRAAHGGNRQDGARFMRPMRATGILAAAVCFVATGCSERSRPRPAAEAGRSAVLVEGQTFCFTDQFRGAADPAGGERRPDGPYRLALGNAYQPVLYAPAPYTIRQELVVPRAPRSALPAA